MTVSSTVYKADSTGNGVTTEFTIPFDLQDESQVLVTKVSAAGVETILVLNTDYTVSGIGTASRKITLTTALPTGERVIRSPNISLTQSVDYVEGDDFPAETHEAAIDKLTLICQQLQEQLNRTVKLDISDAVDIDALITNVQTVAENLTNLNIVAGIDTEITAVAGIESAVSTLAAISSEISAVSAVSSDVADVAAIDTDVTAVAAISAAISTLNGIAADISTIAGVSGDVTTVAGVAADVTTVAGLETEILAVPGQVTAAEAAETNAVAAAATLPSPSVSEAGKIIAVNQAGDAHEHIEMEGGGPSLGLDSIVRVNDTVITQDITFWMNNQTCTVNAGTDTVDKGSDDGFVEGKQVYFETTGVLPAGLALETPYYIRDLTTSTMKLASESGGAAIDITDTGTGTHTIYSPVNGSSVGPIEIGDGVTVDVSKAGSTWSIV
jgi:hypothetical protein